MTSTTKSIVFSNKNQIESDHVKIEALSDKKELKKLVMKRRESRQQLNQSLHATPTQITNIDMPTYIPGATPAYNIPGATPWARSTKNVKKPQRQMCGPCRKA